MKLILESCVEDWKLHRKPLRFIVPGSFIIVRRITVPAEIPKDEIKGYLYMEIGTTIHLPLDEPVFDFKLLVEEEGKL